MPLDDLLSYFEQLTEGSAEPVANLLVDDQGVFGRYRDISLHSVFQALYSADTLQPIAHEALLRAHDASNRSLPPPEAFAIPRTRNELVYFDRLCRTIHALNFVHQADEAPDLFLNVSGGHLLSVSQGGHGRTFETLLGHCRLKPTRIVLEVLEARVDNLQHLRGAIETYKQRGYRVAIDDFGCAHSNFDRLWQLTPDIVKLDRSLIVQAADNERARRILPKLIDIIHDLGASAVCEGIETTYQHDLAIGSGADLLQGYYYSRPSPKLVGTGTKTDDAEKRRGGSPRAKALAQPA